MCMVVFLPMVSWFAGVLSLDMNVHELIKSDGSKLRPHCSWEKECIWNTAVELACTSRLCRSAGYDHGMLMKSSNDMCRSSFTSNVQDGTHQVFWDTAQNWGPHLYDKSVGHGLAVITADCVLKHPAPAWGCLAFFGLGPFMLAAAIFPLMAINKHNRNIDQEIYELVCHANSSMRAH